MVRFRRVLIVFITLFTLFQLSTTQRHNHQRRWRNDDDNKSRRRERWNEDRMSEQEAEAVMKKACESRFGAVTKECITRTMRWCKRRRSRDGSSGKVCRAIKTLKKAEKRKIRDRDAGKVTGATRPPRPDNNDRRRDRDRKGRPRLTKEQKQEVRGNIVGRVQKADPTKLRNINERFNNRAKRQKILQDSIVNRLLAWSPPKKKKGAKPQHTEMTVNKNGDYFAGDIDLSIQQANRIAEMLDKEEFGSSRQKRKIGVAPIFLKWNTMPISYQFSTGLPQSTRNVIKEAIKNWEDNTCVRWQENGPETDRIEFVNGGGCSSYVGRTGGIQEVSIATPGCDVPGIVAHEIGHSLGFFHEQARPDQSTYVRIVYDNISPFRWNNFVPQKSDEVDNFKFPYDYGSVMHYDGYGFALNPTKTTLATTDPQYQDTIGQRIEPSFVDFAQVNAAYCNDKCRNGNPCQHGGYPDPNDCSKCKCPSGFGGKKCEQVQYSTCGGELKAYRQESHISSPNYPSSFRRGDECAWLIKSPGNTIYLEFADTFHFACKDTCDESYVEVKHGPDFRRTGYRFCCNEKPQEKFVASGGEMVVLFRGHGQTSGGFRAKYWSDTNANKPGGKITPKPVTPPPSTSTTTTEYVPPGKEVTNAPGCNCGEWGQWNSGCSQKCGGCGSRVRERSCSKVKCYDKEKRKCNFTPCPKGKNFIWGNGEFHIVFEGCCIGLFKSSKTGNCGGLQNAFVELIGSFLPNLDIPKIPIP